MNLIAKYKKSSYFNIITYGIALSVLLFVLKYFEYQYIVKDFELEFYVGIIAIIFVGLGIFIGQKIISPKKVQTANELIDPSKFDITSREYDVLKLMSEGKSNKQIAEELFLSLPTIKTHSSSIYKKLKVSRRTEAVVKAKELQII